MKSNNEYEDSPDKSSDESSDEIVQHLNISGQIFGSVYQIGKLAIHQVDVFKHLRQGQIALAILIILTPIIWYVVFHYSSTKVMAGDFRIAVAGFSESGSSTSSLATNLSEGVHLRLQNTFAEINPNFTVTIWGPAKVGTIKGKDASERTIAAKKVAERIGADLIVYGNLSDQDNTWHLSPEFYVSAANFYQAEEITGQHSLGTIISIIGQGNIADRISLSTELSSRVQTLAQISIGLAYYSIGDFKKALDHFQIAEKSDGGEDAKGLEVIYLLAGNASLQSKEVELASTYFQKAVSIDPEYARGYLGVAHIYYRQALLSFEKSLNPVDIDYALLDRALATLQRASVATNQPAQSDISTKIHFELGQIFLMQVYSGHETSFQPAIEEFEAVITDYGNGKNPRIQERVAEAHARLGLIYRLSGYIELAVTEYQLSTLLLAQNSERRMYFEQTLVELKAELDRNNLSSH